jgi:hypothetical protein
LQAVIQPEFRFWSGALAAPLNWVTLMDTGYMVRYPPDWRQVDGSPGQPYTLTAQRGEDIITMTAQIYEGAPLTTTENAQAWVLSKWPRALVETTAAESRGETTGFSVSFLNRDADGNQRSMLVTVLNGSDNRLYTLTVQLNSGTRNLLADSTIPELFQVRSAFLLVPVGLTTQQSPTPTSAG